MTIDRHGWAVVVARHTSEELAEKSLRSDGWRVYLPRGRKMLLGVRIDPRTGRRVRTRGYGEVVMRPAFPGYLFAEIHPDQEWSALLSARGVEDVLRLRGPRPPLLTERAIEMVRKLENDGKFDDPRAVRGKAATRTDLFIGASVICEEAWGAISGTIAALNDNDTAIVNWVIFGRESPGKIETSRLEVVAS